MSRPAKWAVDGALSIVSEYAEEALHIDMIHRVLADEVKALRHEVEYLHNQIFELTKQLSSSAEVLP
jgi:hypothetical protein